jgi:uncharacterized protein with LGFP repeats
MSTNPTALTVPGVPTAKITSLRGKIDKVESIFKEATTKIAKLLTDPRLSITATTSDVQRAKQEADAAVKNVKAVAAQELQTIKTETERERDEVLRAVKLALGRPEPANATEALLREQREGRAWARTKGILDNEQAQFSVINEKAKQLAREAIATGDEDALASMRMELSSYMQGRRIAFGASVEAARQLDELIGGERPGVAAALFLQREIEKGVQCVMLAVNYASHAIESGGPFIAIPNWDGKSTRNLAMPGVDMNTGRMGSRVR